MSSRCARRATAALLAAAAAWAGSAPAPGGEEPPRTAGFADRIAVAWVLVPVVVRSRSGYVEGLGRDDFRLWVDERPVAVESFDSGADAPLSLIFLQDLSGSMATGGKLAASRAALTDLVAAVAPSDELALASFAGGRLAVDVPFTGERDVFVEAMASWNPYGTTSLHDAVAWIPEISLEGRHPKRAVVLVTDGVDNASAVPPEAARRAVENAHLPVYVLGLGERPDAPGGDEDGGDAGGYARLLARLATATGGRYFPLAGADGDLGAGGARTAVASLIDDLRAQYVLSFPAAGDGPRRYRRLRVEVRGRGREAVFRIGYTGGPPAGRPADAGR